MDQYKHNFLVVTFVDNTNPPDKFVEPVPWKWVKDGFVYYPNNMKASRQKSNVDSVPDYGDSRVWEKCRLTSIKGRLFSKKKTEYFEEFIHECVYAIIQNSKCDQFLAHR